MKSSVVKTLLCIGALMSVCAWAIYAPPLFHMLTIGAISPVAFLLALVAVISILVGSIRIQFGKGKIAFAMHIVFIVFAAFAMHLFLPVPFVIGVAVSTTALVWLASAQQSTPSDVPASQGRG